MADKTRLLPVCLLIAERTVTVDDPFEVADKQEISSTIESELSEVSWITDFGIDRVEVGQQTEVYVGIKFVDTEYSDSDVIDQLQTHDFVSSASFYYPDQ